MKYFKYFNNKPLQSFVYFLDKKKKITMAPPSSGAQSFANDTGRAWKPRAAGHCDPCFWLAAPDGAPDPHSTGVISQRNRLFFSPEK